MKKSILFLMMAVFAATTLYAAPAKVLNLNSGAVKTTGSAAIASRTVTEDDKGITVTYRFNEAMIEPDPLVPGANFWRMEGFGQTSKEGAPSLPVRNDIIAIPDDGTFTVTVTDSTWTDYECRLTPARRLLLGDEEPPASADELVAIKAVNRFYPLSAAGLMTVQAFRGNRMAYITVSPIKYNSATGTVRAFKSLTYRVDFEGGPTMAARHSANESTTDPDMDFMSKFTLEPIGPGIPIDSVSIIPEPKTVLDPQTYLIISTDKFRTAVKELEQWKKTLGFNVVTTCKKETERWTEAGVAQVIDSVRNAHPDLRYILFIGRAAEIPPRSVTSNVSYYNSFISDIPYVCLDGLGDIIPDIYLGRIPAVDDNDAKKTIDKLIAYEKNPPTDENFYKRISCAAHFEPGKNNTTEKYLLTRTMEEIVQYLSAKKNPIREYYADANVTPLYWRDGAAVPDYLRKPTFKWNASGEDIIKNINEGTFLTLYHGHGAPEGWANPRLWFYFSSFSHIFTNENMPTFVASISCSTGNFDIKNILWESKKVCFAGKFLTHPTGGAMGVIAATNESFVILNDALLCGIIDAIWPNPGIRVNLNSNPTISKTPTPTYTLGQILYQGLFRMAETCTGMRELEGQMRLYHLFGDPSLMLTTEKPAQCNAKIIRWEKAIYVAESYKFKTSTISFHNVKTGETERYSGNSTIFKTETPEDYTVCVSGHNMIPLISYAPSLTSGGNSGNAIKALSQTAPGQTLNVEFEHKTEDGDALRIVNIFTGNVLDHTLAPETSKADIDISTLSNGQYIVTYLRNGTVSDKRQIIVKH